ncbi:TonB-system energizer ExbB [Helicobacter pylori]|nr:biopolymer transporter ExbB [Helicobacter pylori X47-2AL]MUT42152.1 TonB-system energizer ExbB [Helicobacter pylori]MUT74322.1 TonB-system energizer ExbB [Helicobacter pylori]MUT82017.1 TonB-system energizer ExbB [Helicobacter pylori]RVY22415.1 TonB-system energizer ExbB [Helicobacter pylori]
MAVLHVALILRELFYHRQGVFMGGFSMAMLKDYVDVFVFAVLGVASFLALWFVIERVIFYSKVNLKAYDDIDALNLDLTKNLTILYVIYSNAPYVGLLGTVLGIMVIFYDMGVSGGMDAKTIMVGLSLALKATALGLAVAIPTLIAYNSLLRKSDVLSEKFRIMKK